MKCGAQAREGEIVVTATREQRAAVEDIEPERTVDEDGVASYGPGTVGDVLDEIAAEHGDTGEPVLFVNGRPITDPGDIVDYPAEAIERVDVLPRGAGARLGAASDRRAYNVVLKRVFASNIGAVRGQVSSEGGYYSNGGELTFSRISGQKRLNLTLRARRDDEILESERSILQPLAPYPFALAGNLVAAPATGTSEIDPALSALAGRPVVIAALPALAAPSLQEVAARADYPARTDIGRYRTLRPEQVNYEATLNGNHPLNQWLTATLAGRLDLNQYESRQGLRAGLFILPADAPASPFTRDVAIARYFEDDRLDSRSRYLRGNIGLALNAVSGNWQMSLRGDYRYSRFSTNAWRQRQGSSTPIALVAGGPNPFVEDLADLVTLYSDSSASLTKERAVQVSATGPLVSLPAGPLRANLNASWRHVGQRSRNDSPFFQNRKSLGRDEVMGQGSLEVPLVGGEESLAVIIGKLSVVLDQSITDIGDRGTFHREGYALNWSPVDKVTVQASLNRQRTAPEAQQLADPIVTTENVRYFDVLRRETVEVTQVYGGNPGLVGERQTTRRVSVTAQVLPQNRLQLNAEYLSTSLADPISSLPPTSSELMAAFPDRFLRDPSGRMISVDLRPVNFVSRETEQLRWGLIASVPLAATAAPGATPVPGASRLRLQLTLSHTINFKDEVLARAGLTPVDLLDGGAIGFGGGGNRHLVDAGANLSDREVGLRLNATWRSSSILNTGAPGSFDRLRFSPVIVVNLRAFADLQQVWRDKSWLKGAKVSFAVGNLLNDRQAVRDTTGATPLQYQRGNRDPLGRTIELELRKAF